MTSQAHRASKSLNRRYDNLVSYPKERLYKFYEKSKDYGIYYRDELWAIIEARHAFT